jgi:hypothetical protein
MMEQKKRYPESNIVILNKVKKGNIRSSDDLKESISGIPFLDQIAFSSLLSKDTINNNHGIYFFNIAFVHNLTEEEVAILQEVSAKYISLPYVGEEIAQAIKLGENELRQWDFKGAFSQRLLNVFDSFNEGSQMKKHFKSIGFAELDQVKFFERDEILKKYEINTHKKILYLSTLPLFSPSSHFQFRLVERLIISGAWWAKLLGKLLVPLFRKLSVSNFASYKDVLKNIRQAFPESEYYIVAKTRDKHRDPYFVKLFVDQVIQDQHFFPFATLELMYISDFYVGFSSASIMETLYLKKPSITLELLPLDKLTSPVITELRKVMFKDYLWNTKGFSMSFQLFTKKGCRDFLSQLNELKDMEIDQSIVNELIQDVFTYEHSYCEKLFQELDNIKAEV